jgi:undecaprenyl-diphosphatase
MKNLMIKILNWDTKLYLKIHGWDKRFWLHMWMKYWTHLGSNPTGYIYGAMLIGLHYLNKESLVFNLLFSIIFSQIIIHSLKRLINRPRPYAAMILKTVKRPPGCIYSFPSGHTAIAFTMALGGSVLIPVLTPLFLIMAFFVGLSRTVLGYHYPIDVLVGGSISVLVHSIAILF